MRPDACQRPSIFSRWNSRWRHSHSCVYRACSAWSAWVAGAGSAAAAPSCGPIACVCASTAWPGASDSASDSATAGRWKRRDCGIADSSDGLLRRASMEPDPDPDAKGRRSRAGPGPVVAWPALGTAPRPVRTPPMIRLFGRKKPDHETADEDRSRTGTGERTGRYSIEELAAAFPDAGAVAAPVEPEQESAPP